MIVSIFIIIQITNRTITRQMTTITQCMRYLRKPRGDLLPKKIFLSETSWHKFQTCPQTKTPDSKVNIMYELLLKHHCSAMCFFFIIKLKVKKYEYFKQLFHHLNNLSTGHSSWRASSMHRG